MGESAWNLTIPPPADYRDSLESINVFSFWKISSGIRDWLTENSHFIRVTIESMNIFLYPFESKILV